MASSQNEVGTWDSMIKVSGDVKKSTIFPFSNAILLWGIRTSSLVQSHGQKEISQSTCNILPPTYYLNVIFVI